MKKVFYGWWMVAAAGAMQLVQGTLLLQSFGAYFAVLRDDRGWSKTELSGAAAIHQLEAAVLGPVIGWFIDRFGAQGVIRTGVVLFGVGFILFSFIESLLSFYGAFIVTALGASLCGFFPLNVSLIHWFEKKRARALASMQVGMAAGGLLLPVVALAMATYGWRATAFASGVLILVICLPLSFVFRRRPEDHGMRMDGEPPTQMDLDTHEKKADDGTRDFTAREALRTPAFWLISLGHGFALLVVQAINTHAITHMKEGLGYTGGPRRVDRRPLQQAHPLGVLHARPRGRPALPHLRHRPGDDRRLRRAARRRLGNARRLHAGDPRRLIRPQRDRHDPRPVADDHHHRPDRRTDDRRHHGRHDGQLPRRLHHHRAARGAGLDFLSARPAPGASAAGRLAV